MGQTSLGSGSRRSVAGLVCAVLLVAAGCGGGGDAAGDEPSRTSATDAPPTTEAPATTSTTAAPLSDEEAVLAAYQGFLEMWLATNDPPDLDHPDLARYATGASYERVRETIEENAAFGLSYRSASPSLRETQVRSVRVDGDQASLETCEIDDGLVVRTETGEVENDQVVSSLVDVRLVREDGEWKVERTDFIKTVSGAGGCDG